MISALFNEILYRPILNALIFLYNTIPGHNFGLAIILLTIIIRFILFPLNQKSLKAQSAMTKIQPELKKIQQKYKDNSTERNKAIMAFYKENKVNPASGCLPILIQFPILIALFQVLRQVFDPSILDQLYYFIQRPEVINPSFLGIDLALPNLSLAVLAGVFQFIQSKLMMGAKKDTGQTKKEGFDMASLMGKQMLYFMPIFTVVIASRFPAGLALYWTMTTLFSIGQQYLINRKSEKPVNVIARKESVALDGRLTKQSR